MFTLRSELSRILIRDFVENELHKGHFETRENLETGSKTTTWVANGVSSKNNGTLVSLHHIFEGTEREKLLKNQTMLDQLAVEGVIRIWNYSAQKSTSIFMDMRAEEARSLIEEYLADMAYGDDCYIPKATPKAAAPVQASDNSEEKSSKGTRKWAIMDGSKKFNVTIEEEEQPEIKNVEKTAKAVDEDAPHLAAAAEN